MTNQNFVNFNKLLISIAGILIFISLDHFIHLNGFTPYAPLIILTGVVMLFWTKIVARKIPLDFFTNSVVLTISHILIFIGAKVYLDLYLENSWLIYLAVGIILLNKSRQISASFFKEN